jgi:hypothetical protein
MKQSLALVLLTAVMLIAVQAKAQKSNSPQGSIQLTAAEQLLVDESRKAIIETGLSESYFDSHFKVIRVENKTSDRRVVWQLRINGYITFLTDSIGYYTEGTKQINVHNVRQALGRTREIVKTIPRARALKLMTACIGSFSEPSVQFGPVAGTAELLLVAHKQETLSRRKLEERERLEAQEREREKVKGSKTKTGADEIENEGDEGTGEPIIFGYINLQTGKCTKGKGVTSP